MLEAAALLIAHFLITFLINRIARNSNWLIISPIAIAVTGFFAYILIQVPIRTKDDLVHVHGHLDRHYETAEGFFGIDLQGDTRRFLISSADRDFFDEERFIQALHIGDEISIAILKDSQCVTSDSYVVFEVRSNSDVYLPAEPLLESRLHDLRFAFPLLALASLSIFILTIVATRLKDTTLDVALGVLVGTLLLMIVEGIANVMDVNPFIPFFFLPITYPAIWVIECGFGKRERKDWLLSIGLFVVMLGLASISMLLYLGSR